MSYCPMCGSQNPDGVAFCAQCGQSMTMQQPVQPGDYVNNGYHPGGYNPTGYTAPATTLPVAANITAIIAMVCGIISCCTFYVGFIFSIPALILAALSRGKTPAGVENSKAKVGTITGIIGIGLSVLWFIIFVSAFGL